MSRASPSANDPAESDSSSDAYDSEDNNFEDWISPGEVEKPCRSLFGEDRELGSVAEALEDAKTNHGVDLDQICKRLEFDFYERTRLVNYIRKNHPPPSEIQNVTGRERFFTDDVYLIPVVEDDPLLQIPADDWSDDDGENVAPGPSSNLSGSNLPPPSGDISLDLRRSQHAVRQLQRELAQARQDLVEFKKVVNRTLGVTDVRAWVQEQEAANGPPVPGKRGPDPEYFQRAMNEPDDIPEVRRSDRTRGHRG